MHREKATLPTLGTISVDFHKESEVVASCMGRREWDRLRTVPHLGVAGSVFSGVHHSRLEYVLLQCAVTSLVAKLHRHDEQFALSNEVKLAGIEAPISSGEELLKIWILLSNYGHAQYTYGVERSLLQQAIDNPKVRDWLIEDIQHTDLRNWALNVVDTYTYTDFRYLLTLLRVSLLPPRDRRKKRFAHYLRNLLLPPTTLFPTSPAARYKIGRLRELFKRIRQLSMVALDAHYSHHPISINLNSAIIGLADLLPTATRASGFDELLQNAAGWLADELYFHPTAVAAQKEYELRFAAKFPRRFKDATTENRRPTLLHELMTQGLGPPKTQKLKPLVRLTFPNRRPRLLGASTTLYESAKQLGRDLVSSPSSYLSIDFNSHTNSVHVDVLYRPESANLRSIAGVYTRLQRWLLRSLEAESLERIRGIYRGKEERQRAKERDLARQLDRYAFVYQSIFDSLIRLLLPENHKGVISEFTPRRRMPVVARLQLSDVTVDTATPHLQLILRDNPDAQPPERLQEIRCLANVLRLADAPFILVCPEKFIV
jgi:hypothetical protein